MALQNCSRQAHPNLSVPLLAWESTWFALLLSSLDWRFCLSNGLIHEQIHFFTPLSLISSLMRDVTLCTLEQRSSGYAVCISVLFPQPLPDLIQYLTTELSVPRRNLDPRRKLLSCNAIVALCFRQHLAPKGYYFLLSVLDLI